MRTWADYKKTMRREDVIFDLSRDGDVAGLCERVSCLSEGAAFDINMHNLKGNSPLMLAAYHGHAGAVEFLLQNGADPNSTDLAGSSVLMGVAFKGDVVMAKRLVTAGADVAHKNQKGQDALSYARLFGRAEMVRYLKSIQHQPAIFSWREVLSGWGALIRSRRS